MNVIKINPVDPAPEAIEQAAQILQSGGLVVYPTDTAYGLGVNALDEQAVRKMYEVKGRDFSKPTHVVVRDWNMVETIAEPNDVARKLYDAFLPGPLTIILKKKPIVPALLTSGLTTIGVRIPDSPITQALSRIVPVPYTTPSANISGGATPYSAQGAISQIGQHIDLVIDAGELPPVLPSTIVDITVSPPKILRRGPIEEAKIKAVLGMELL